MPNRQMLHPKSGSYDFDTRSMMLEEATALGMGLAMEIGNSMTRFYADPNIEVGLIYVTAPATYKGIPEHVVTLQGADPGWVPSWEADRMAVTLAMIRSQQEPGQFAIDDAHLFRQFEFSQRTFGPGSRFEGVIDHIRQELIELEEKHGEDVTEWADVIILAFDGALRQGFDRQEILDAVRDKQTKNEGRVWPDWRTQDTTKAITHDRSFDEVKTVPENWVRLSATVLPLRVVAGLARHGYETVGQLRDLLAHDPKLMTLRGIGPVAHDQIKNMLSGEDHWL